VKLKRKVNNSNNSFSHHLQLSTSSNSDAIEISDQERWFKGSFESGWRLGLELSLLPSLSYPSTSTQL